MPNIRKISLTLALAVMVTVGINGTNNAYAASAKNTDKDAREALDTLYHNNRAAEELSHKAKGILVFPNIVKAGFIFGGSYGEGELLKDSMNDGYYNSITGSWGLQAGAQSYGYVVFLMTDEAMRYVHQTHGLEIGVGPTVVVVNEGLAKNLSTSTLKNDAYAFIFNQQGLMAGVSIEGTKITRINK